MRRKPNPHRATWKTVQPCPLFNRSAVLIHGYVAQESIACSRLYGERKI